VKVGIIPLPSVFQSKRVSIISILLCYLSSFSLTTVFDIGGGGTVLKDVVSDGPGASGKLLFVADLEIIGDLDLSLLRPGIQDMNISTSLGNMPGLGMVSYIVCEMGVRYR